MIQMRSMLWEISLSGVTPYATAFTWQSAGGGAYEDVVSCDGISVTMIFSPDISYSAERQEYSFAYMLPSQATDWGQGTTISHQRSAAIGQLNYMRLLATVKEALLSFIAAHAPQSVDIAGDDANADKAQQKTRIYKALLDASQSEIATAGYSVMMKRNKLCLVRKSTADATGIQDKLDMSQVKIKRAVVNGLLVFIPHYNGERMGAFRLRPVAGGYRIKETVLYDRYRNQGVGKAMYRYMIHKLKEQGDRLYSDSYQSAEAAGVWDALVRAGVAVKLSDGTYAGAE